MSYLMSSYLIRGTTRQLGYCLIENVLSPERAAAFGKRVVDQAEAERVSAAEFKYSDTAYGDDVNQWVNQLLNKGEIFRSLPLHPVARALATHVLGAEHLLSAIDSHITYMRGASHRTFTGSTSVTF